MRGFTLIELMLVIVIIGVFASMVGLAVGQSAQREQRLVLARLEDDLALVRLESEEQMQPLGVRWQLPRNDQPAGYQVVRLDPDAREVAARWQADPAFAFRPLPEGMGAQVSALAPPQPDPAAAPLDAQAPVLLWYGNGEANPARIQLLQDQQPLGEPLYVADTGRISHREDGDDID